MNLLYNRGMSKIYVSANANENLIEYLKSKCHDIVSVGPLKNVSKPISCHPDLLYCKLGSYVYAGDENLLGSKYPEDIIFNGFSSGKFFIHATKYTYPPLLKKVRELGMNIVDVAQGYAKCSIVEVDENSIITYDRGISQKAESAGMDVLLVSSGHVDLPGYSCGFIGGAGGLVGKEVIFNGNLAAHPDCSKIESFIRDKGLACKFFPDYPLTDIGSIVEERTSHI